METIQAGRLASTDTLVRLLSGASLLSAAIVLALPAFAQDAAPVATPAEAPVDPAPAATTADPAAPVDPAAEAASDAAVRDIIVTGSRVQANGFQNPTPVTIISSTDLSTKAPSNIPDALNQLPQFSNSTSPTKSETRFSVTPVIGNFLNLRGLSPRRTLIMLDGVRVPPTSFDGSVDVNTLPQMLVQRVDVVTGGASAAYGSDAVVGVVNFVLDKKFEGLKVTAQSGISTYGDAASYRLGLAAGVSLMDDRLRIIASVERYDINGLANNDRPLGGQQHCTAGTGTAANPYRTIPDCRFNTASNGGRTTGGGGLNNYVFLPGGAYRPFNAGGAGGVGGDGGLIDTDTTITAPLRTMQGFGRISFEATPDITVFAQAAVNQSDAGPLRLPDGHYAGQSTGLTIFQDNAFLPAGARALMGTAPSFQYSYIGNPQVAEELGGNTLDLQDARQRTRSINFIAGVEGKFGDGWSWNVNYVHGGSQLTARSRETELPKLAAAADAVFDGNGNVVCRVTLTNPGLYLGCVPINLFGPASASREAVDYVYGVSRFRTKNLMDMGSVNLSGTLFNLPYGPLSISVGGEYRKQTLEQTSNADPAIAIDRTGLPGAPASITRFQLTNAASASGSVSVKEGYVEFVAPLLARLPFADLLELNAAGRYTDYSTSGSVKTWKLGLNYKPFADLRLRGTISRDIRAPSLYELFAGPSNSVATLADPHTGVTAIATTSVVSNSALEPERGLTKIVGLVYQPSWLPGFGLSIDAYDIKITDAIVASTAVTNVQLCEASGGTGPECALVLRPLPFSDRSAANFPTLVLSQPLNLADIHQRGLDIEVGYRFDGLGGKFDVRGFANYVPTLDQQQSPTQPVRHYAGYLYNAKLRGSISATYSSDAFSLNVQERFTGSYKMPAFEGASVYADHGKAPNQGYTDVTLTFYTMERKGEFFINALNAFNVKPPLLNASAVPDLSYPTVKQTYDVTGRYLTAGFRIRI
ncbi:TonB-dependent receptor plug domain-containing protein [Novosphingobium sp. BL-52-GroH]|uniref:TonB-dependent receptor plug domain-containing protein n=1 Tax=Novosphingobium sp. BL-52-GroH TaxID=3349877 RepID=UPI00384D9734